MLARSDFQKPRIKMSRITSSWLPVTTASSSSNRKSSNSSNRRARERRGCAVGQSSAQATKAVLNLCACSIMRMHAPWLLLHSAFVSVPQQMRPHLR